jgi:hypothetical protein
VRLAAAVRADQTMREGCFYWRKAFFCLFGGETFPARSAAASLLPERGTRPAPEICQDFYAIHLFAVKQ